VRALLLPIGVAVLVAAPVASAGSDPFSVQVIPSVGRTVTAELADLDGDGRVDLLQAVFTGLPPAERRVFRVYLQRADGSFAARFDLEVPVPEGSATYDVANVDGAAGDEVLLLQPRGVGILGFARGAEGALAAKLREARIPDGLTLGAAVDERGLDRMRIASFDFGPEPLLIVPGVAETYFLAADGGLRARIHPVARANYFIQPTGPTLTESDIQLFLDSPRISVGDIDGDGRPDILAASRHELDLFFQRDDGRYPRDADRKIALERVTPEDHIRGSGSVRSTARDIDGDGLLDLLLSLTRGGLMNASATSTIHFNRGSGWDLDQPDVTFESEQSISADQLIDLDGDGRLEIVRMSISISVLELVEIFVQRALDAWLNAYAFEKREPGAPSTPPVPLFSKKVDVELDLDTSRPAGFVPTIDYDLNGDGRVDFLGAADGTRIEVFLGGGDAGFERVASQAVSSEGQIRGGDLDADGLPDFVLFNSRRLDAPLQLIRNLGTLPGSPRRAVLRAGDD